MTVDRARFASEYAFRSRFHDLDGLRYHYLDEGSGEPLLMVHGNPTWSFLYRRLIDEFSASHRVLAVDHIGCGLSDKPQRYDYSLARHIENLERLVERLDLRDLTLLVHDWGGAIGLGAFVRQPERIKRLVLFNTAAFRSKEMPLRIAVCRIPWVGEFLVRGLNGFARCALFMATAKPDRMTPAVRAGYLAPYDSWANRIAIDRFVRDIPLNERHPSYETLQRIEAGLDVFRDKPILLAWGMRDWCFTPRFLDRWIEYFPTARVERFADAGHYVTEDAHEHIVPLLREFLNQPHEATAPGRSAHGD